MVSTPLKKVFPLFNKRKTQLNVRSFEADLHVFDKTAHQAMIESIGGLKHGIKKLFQDALSVLGKKGALKVYVV